MKEELELISKKKKYVEKLRKELHYLEESLEKQNEEKRKIETINSFLYVNLNQKQRYNEENSILTYLFLASSGLLLISLFCLYTFIQGKILLWQIIITFLTFNIGQVACFALASKMVRKHFKVLRMKRQEEIDNILKQITDLREERIVVDKEYNTVYQRKQEILMLILKEEEDIKKISDKVIGELLSLDINEPLLVTLDSLINKGEEILIDTDMMRELKI